MYEQLGHSEVQFTCQLDLPRCLRLCQRGSAAGSCLRLSGLEVSEEGKERVEIWTSEEQRRSMSRRMAAESEQLLGVVRSVALTHKEKYYRLRLAKYPDARAEDMTHRQVEPERSTARVIAR